MSPERLLRIEARQWARRRGWSFEDAVAFAVRYMAEYGQLTTAGMRPTFAEATALFANTTERSSPQSPPGRPPP